MTVTPTDLLKRLSEGADPRRKRSLSVIHAVCESQREHGSTDYSLTTIGRLSQTKGGPSANALGNPTGAPYRQLIACHRAANGSTSKPRRSSADSDGLLDGVRDPVQRARIELLRDEVRALRGRVADLQQIANASARVTVGRPPGGDAGTMEGQWGLSSHPDLLPHEREALSSALDRKRLEEIGIAIGSRGRLELLDGTELFPVGFASALAKVVALWGTLPPSLPVTIRFEGSHIGGTTDAIP